MLCAQQAPKSVYQEQFDKLVDKQYDWNQVKHNYSKVQLESMPNWISLQQEIDNSIETDEIDINQLNQYQRFTYIMIKKFNNKKKTITNDFTRQIILIFILIIIKY
jgi:hypothetical protein